MNLMHVTPKDSHHVCALIPLKAVFLSGEACQRCSPPKP